MNDHYVLRCAGRGFEFSFKHRNPCGPVRQLSSCVSTVRAWQVEGQAPTLKFTPAGDFRVAASSKNAPVCGARAAQRGRREVAGTSGCLGKLLAFLSDGF